MTLQLSAKHLFMNLLKGFPWESTLLLTMHIFAFTPFPGEQKNEAKKDAYNFYLSQLRIRIEMTFGRLVNKWGIFKRPLQVQLKNVGKVFICATRLHNFCINEGDADSGLNSNAACDLTNIVHTISDDIVTMTIPNNSIMREIVLEDIANLGLLRPAYNLERNNTNM